MIVLAALVLAVTVTALAVWRDQSTDRLLRDRRTLKVLVELHTGETFQGALLSCDARSIVLGSVTLAGDPPTVVDGDLLIPRGDVKFLQRP